MADERRSILICSCEGSMPIDAEGIRRGCRAGEITTAHQLCCAELDKFRVAVTAGMPLTVACTQEAPLFDEVAAEVASAGASDADIRYANIRESAGWSNDTAHAAPKMAALLAVAAEPAPEIPYVTLESEGSLL